jgi:hypothetical protein
LYPIPYQPRVPGGGIPFHKKEWIEVDLYPPDDKRDRRPESRTIDLQSVKVLEKVDDEVVKKVIAPHVSANIAAIDASGASLGFIKPDIQNYALNMISTEVRDEQLRITEDGIGEQDMIKLKQESYYYFNCQEPTGCSCANQPHKMEIHDWEVNELYRNVVSRTKDRDEIYEKMRWKWFDWMKNERDTYFMMGTHHRWHNWLVVSVLYLRK